RERRAAQLVGAHHERPPHVQDEHAGDARRARHQKTRASTLIVSFACSGTSACCPSVIASTLTIAVIVFCGDTGRVRITWLLSAIDVNQPAELSASTSFIPSTNGTFPGFVT